MALKLQTAAADAPVTLAEAKVHLRVDTTDEDALITSLIYAAVLDAEHLMGRAVMPQKWQLTLDRFGDGVFAPWPLLDYTGSVMPTSIKLQRPPVTAIDSVKYVHATTGVLTTLDPSTYQLANASDYTAEVVPAYGLSWPAARAQPEAVQIIFSCGYADAPAVPAPIKAWIKLRVGALYENRESVAVGQRIVRVDLPFVDSLLDRYRAHLL